MMEISERKQVLDQFAASEAQLLALTDGLTPQQWAFQTAPGRWSIAGILEHVMAVENRILRAIGKMSAMPAQALERSAVKDETLWKQVLNRTNPLSAPEAVQPAGKFSDTGELLNEFRATRARSVQFVASTDAELRGHLIPHMAFGELDLYQWLIVLSLHGSRHAAQIEEIKADRAFPK
jgi:uncharacterized damage-inducible protein DinB